MSLLKQNRQIEQNLMRTGNIKETNIAMAWLGALLKGRKIHQRKNPKGCQ